MKLPRIFGQTLIEVIDSDVVIKHSGQPTDTIRNSVKPNVDAILGAGSFNRLIECSKVEGEPSNRFIMRLPKTVFDSMFG